MKENNPGEIKYGKSIPKCALSTIVNVLSGMLIGALLIFTLGISDSKVLKVVAQVLAVLCYLAMIYVGAWSDGDRDRNLVNFKRIKKDMLKGLKFGLLAMIPFMLLTILLIVAMFIGNDTTALVLRSTFRVLNFNILLLVNSFMSPDEVTWKGILLVNCFYLVIPLTSLVGYILGYKRVSVITRLVYQKKDDGKKKKKNRY